MIVARNVANPNNQINTSSNLEGLSFRERKRRMPSVKFCKRWRRENEHVVSRFGRPLVLQLSD
jgi:hypothetical protein